jgi:hypothetical protein
VSAVLIATVIFPSLAKFGLGCLAASEPEKCSGLPPTDGAADGFNAGAVGACAGFAGADCCVGFGEDFSLIPNKGYFFGGVGATVSAVLNAVFGL